MLDALAGTALGTAELRTLLGADDRLPAVVSMLCDEGLLLRDRPTGSRRSSAFRYRRWEDVYPGLDLSVVPEAGAIEELVRRYVRTYGPVSGRDIVWWTGLPLRKLGPALDALAGELVRVPGAGGLVIDAGAVPDVDTAPAGAGCVALLPVLDPS